METVSYKMLDLSYCLQSLHVQLLILKQLATDRERFKTSLAMVISTSQSIVSGILLLSKFQFLCTPFYRLLFVSHGWMI